MILFSILTIIVLITVFEISFINDLLSINENEKVSFSYDNKYNYYDNEINNV